MKRKIYTVTHESMNSSNDFEKCFPSKKLAEEFVSRVGYGYIKEYTVEDEIPDLLKFSVFVTDEYIYTIHLDNSGIEPNSVEFLTTHSFHIILLAKDYNEARLVARSRAADLFSKLKNYNLKESTIYTVYNNGQFEEESQCNAKAFSKKEIKELDMFLNIPEEKYINRLFEQKFEKFVSDYLTDHDECTIYREPEDSTFTCDNEGKQRISIIMYETEFIYVPYDKWNIAIYMIKFCGIYSRYEIGNDKIIVYK